MRAYYKNTTYNTRTHTRTQTGATGLDSPTTCTRAHPFHNVSLHAACVLCIVDCALYAETYLIAPSLQLVRSQSPANREVGVGRVDRWHSSDSVLPEVVAQGGAESLLAALPAAQPATRNTILELLVRMAPVGDARTRLLANDAAVRATSSCSAADGRASPEAAAAVERCHVLAAALGKALHECDSAAAPAAAV